MHPLIDIAAQTAPFQTPDGRTFAYAGAGYTPVRSQAFRKWFDYRYFSTRDTLPAPGEFQSFVCHLEAVAAQAAGAERIPVHHRVEARSDRIRLSLADPDGQYIEITSNGWALSRRGGAHFHACDSAIDLPEPVESPDPAVPLQTLRSCLNLAAPADWRRCLAWLLAAMRPIGQLPVLILQGPPRSGKSFIARALRAVIDPDHLPLHTPPTTPRQLHLLAQRHYVLAFDHVSTLPASVADALCRLSSGIAIPDASDLSSASQTDAPRARTRRPTILTVADRWTCPPDLAARALVVHCPAIPDGDLRSEEHLTRIFEPALPAILGALCTAASTALREYENAELPQGSDASAWASAAAPALGCTAEEMRDAFHEPPPLHPFVAALRDFLTQNHAFSGTASELLDHLPAAPGFTSPKGVSQQLRLHALTLAGDAIDVRFTRAPRGQRLIHLRAAFSALPASAACPPLCSADTHVCRVETHLDARRELAEAEPDPSNPRAAAESPNHLIHLRAASCTADSSLPRLACEHETHLDAPREFAEPDLRPSVAPAESLTRDASPPPPPDDASHLQSPDCAPLCNPVCRIETHLAPQPEPAETAPPPPSNPTPPIYPRWTSVLPDPKLLLTSGAGGAAERGES